MNYPIELNEMPADINLKKIKPIIYEGYAVISEEIRMNPNFVTDMIKHMINEYRTQNFFVKRIYTKYTIPSRGITILAFELVRLREPIVEKLLK